MLARSSLLSPLPVTVQRHRGCDCHLYRQCPPPQSQSEQLVLLISPAAASPTSRPPAPHAGLKGRVGAEQDHGDSGDCRRGVGGAGDGVQREKATEKGLCVSRALLKTQMHGDLQGKLGAAAERPGLSRRKDQRGKASKEDSLGQPRPSEPAAWGWWAAPGPLCAWATQNESLPSPSVQIRERQTQVRVSSDSCDSKSHSLV